MGQKFLLSLQLTLPLAQSNLQTTEAPLGVACSEPLFSPAPKGSKIQKKQVTGWQQTSRGRPQMLDLPQFMAQELKLFYVDIKGKGAPFLLGYTKNVQQNVSSLTSRRCISPLAGLFQDICKIWASLFQLQQKIFRQKCESPFKTYFGIILYS